MSRKSYLNVNAANQYARDVVRGKIEAGRYVQEACQRHLDDLSQEKMKAFKYRFDKDLAEQAAKFIQLLPHTKGEWAFKRMPITLEPWQLFIVCSAFGWVHKGSRLRRFREVYTEIPRKNGKSAISAGVALYCFTCDDEFGAEVYSGATTEKQAWEVFRPARLMCKRTPMLTEAFGIEVNASNLNRPADGARLEPLIGNPGDGQSPSCAIVDEYHEHDTDDLYTTMLTGMGARRQPLMWAITTAGYNIEGPCYDKRREVIEMLSGNVPNDELFGVIYTVDEGDDWTSPDVLRKANPNMGGSVYADYRYILEEAKADSHLNPVNEAPIDPFGATGLSHALADERINPIIITQNFTHMSDLMKELEAAIQSGRFHHYGNPIMSWCIGDVVGKTMGGNDDIVRPIKEQKDGKIDGAVALIMAMGRAILHDEPDFLSNLDPNDLLIL